MELTNIYKIRQEHGIKSMCGKLFYENFLYFKIVKNEADGAMLRSNAITAGTFAFCMYRKSTHSLKRLKLKCAT